MLALSMLPSIFLFISFSVLVRGDVPLLAWTTYPKWLSPSLYQPVQTSTMIPTMNPLLNGSDYFAGIIFKTGSADSYITSVNASLSFGSSYYFQAGTYEVRLFNVNGPNASSPAASLGIGDGTMVARLTGRFGTDFLLPASRGLPLLFPQL